MKIAMVTPFYPPESGGTAYHVFKLAHALSKRHSVTVIKSNSVSGTARDESVRVLRVPSLTPPPYPYQTLSNFRIPLPPLVSGRIIEKEQFDIIHFHGHHNPLVWEIARKRWNAARLLTLHGMYALNPEKPYGKTFLEEVFNRAVFSWLLRRVNGVVGLTKKIAEYAKRYSPSRVKFFVIPNAVDVDVYAKNIHRKSEYRRKYALPDDANIVLFRGRFAQVKGVLDLARASATFRSDRSLFFVFVGEGPLREALLKILGNNRNFRIFSWSSLNAIHELYIASDICVLPSRSEGLPITIMEAMASGLHVVVTPVGGVPEVLEKYENKTLIEEFSTRGVVMALSKAIEQLRSNTRETRVRIPDWGTVASQYEIIYEGMTHAWNKV